MRHNRESEMKGRDSRTGEGRRDKSVRETNKRVRGKWNGMVDTRDKQQFERERRESSRKMKALKEASGRERARKGPMETAPYAHSAPGSPLRH